MCADSIRAEVYFLTPDDLHHHEKPYSLRYPPNIDIPQSNIRNESHNVEIQNMRPLLDSLDFESCGFGMMQVASRMSYGDFASNDRIESIYREEIETAFRTTLRAPHVYIADFNVRRRHPEFPISTGEEYEYQQPTARAHIDFTREEAIRMIREVYGSGAEELLKSPWQVINAWRPLRGPLNDWPLAICDSTSIDLSKDTMSADIVYPNWATENKQIYYSHSQRWFYLPDQAETEVLIFKSATSESIADACKCAVVDIGVFPRLSLIEKLVHTPDFTTLILVKMNLQGRVLSAEYFCFMPRSIIYRWKLGLSAVHMLNTPPRRANYQKVRKSQDLYITEDTRVRPKIYVGQFKITSYHM